MQTFEIIERGQVQYYINKMNEGDKNAREKVIYHYSNLVIKIIEKDFNNKKYCKEDLFQVGLETLIKTLNNYSKNSPHILSAKMNVIIRQEIKKYINQDDKYNTYKYGNTKKEIIYDFTKENEKDNKFKCILDSIENLSPKEKEIICLYFFENMTQKEIAKIYNVSNSRIQQILKSGVIHIKKNLNKKKIVKKWTYKPEKPEKLRIYIEKKKNINPQLHINEYNEIINAYKNIINHYIDHIIGIVNTKYNNYNYIKDDLIQIGILGLLNAIVKYAKSEPEIFLTKINQYINIEIDKYINKEKIYNEYKNNNIIENEELNFTEYYEKKENIRIILDAITKLPKTEENIIHLYFYEKLELEEIAKIYNLDISYVQQLLKCGINHIKILLNKEISQKDNRKKI